GANAFYKTMPFFANAEIAGVLQGTDCPVVLSSRGDSVLTKYYSIAVALA
ncbi:MAG: phosphate butyryltransferase, partial [Prevotellamassilia sp.]|nr:phosphate butyryltransferase [Prevotellamassilia sp.]